MPIELIALDLDDTLLRQDLTISEANRAAIAAARDRRVKVVLASGRNIPNMRNYARLLGLDGPGECLICSNGAEIVETASGRVVYERHLEASFCREIVDALQERGFPWQVYRDGCIFASELSPWTAEDSRLVGQPVIRVDDVEAFLANGQTKFVVPAEPERIAALRGEISRLFEGRAEVLTSKPYLMEVLPKGVDKGEALRVLASRLGISLESAMAAGDAMNDLGMLRAVAYSCVPANAIDAAKEIARYVSPLTNEDDFVAEAIGRFALR